MTRKLWFQLGVGILLLLFIIKYVVEVNWLFSPIFIVLKTIFIPLLLGGVLFYITVPLQAFLEKFKTPRWVSIIVILLLLTGLITGAFFIVIPPISEEVTKLAENAPAIIQESNNLILQATQFTGDMPDWVEENLEDMKNSLQTISVQFGKWTVTLFQSFLQVAIIMLLTPFFLIFMLKDHEKLVPFVSQFFSGETKKWVVKTFKDIDDVLSLYIRGQIMISAILALMLFTGYFLIGLNFALLLAVFALFMNIIPFVGPWIAFIPALLIALFQDPIMAIWVSLITLVAQQIDAQLITPNVMGRTLNIHPLTIITILLAASSIAGFMGILLAVPAYAVGKAIISNIYEHRKEIKETATKTI